MNKKFVARFAISAILGIIFGLVCVSLAKTNNPDIWGTPLMWSIIYNRFMMGVVISITGVHIIHPLFGFRFRPYLRGFVIGILVSIDLAIGVFMNPVADAARIFWLTLIAGGIYGLIIDMVATRFGGEGPEILGK